jgi:hypothetical protein
MENIGYYLFLLAVIVVGFIIVKRVASCMIRSIVLIVVLLALAFVYFVYLK